MRKRIRIERTELRPGRTEVDQASVGPRGYELAAGSHTSKERKQTYNAIFVATLDEAAVYVKERRFHIRMGNPPEYGSLIEPDKVTVIWA
jgi:hypothetical protein